MAARPRRAERMPPDERRAAIVEATLPLVFEHGDRVTVRLIAEAAGVAEGTIFTVFADKDALMDAVKQKAFDPAQILRELAAVDPAPPLRERLVEVVEILRRHLHRAFLLMTALGMAPPPKDGERAEERRRVNASFVTAIAAVIEPDAAGLTVAPEELAHLLRLLTFSATHPVVNDGGPLSAERIVGVLLDGTLADARVPASSTTGGN